MPERIIKNKRKSKCYWCGKDITTDYKVRFKHSRYDRKSKYFHLTCYKRRILRMIEATKIQIKELNKAKRKLKNYTKYMILENLGER